MLRRAVKWTLIVVVLAEWYTRGGREFLFGDAFAREDSLEHFRLWIDMPYSVGAYGALPVEIHDPNGEVVGIAFGSRLNRDARDYAGHPTEQMQVHAEFERAKLGYPINVAIAQAEDFTRRTLAGSLAG